MMGCNIQDVNSAKSARTATIEVSKITNAMTVARPQCLEFYSQRGYLPEVRQDCLQLYLESQGFKASNAVPISATTLLST